jgi:hypothetical protein
MRIDFMENRDRTPPNIKEDTKKGDIKPNQFFLIFGIIFIIAYFTILGRLEGPYIVKSRMFQSESESWSVTIKLPIWIIFVYIGCAALFVGFLIKFLSELRDPDQQLRFMVFLGVIITSANILTFFIYQTLEWFKGIYIPILHILAPIFFILAVAVSIIYLVLLIVDAVRDIRSRKRVTNLMGKH